MLSGRIKHLSPCQEATNWIDTQADCVTGWKNCERGDWMLWLLARTGQDHKQIVLAACKCARLALKYTSDERVVNCISATEKWAYGDASVSLENVKQSRIAAADAADAAYAAATATAAAAAYAAYAADAAYAAATAAYAAADAYAAAYAAAAAAAAYAADAAADAAYRQARLDTLKQCADIVREYFPECPIKD